MGAHYGSIHVLTDDAGKVRLALEQLSEELKIKFLLAPPTCGWVAVFPEQCGQDFGVSKRLAEKIHAPLLHCLVHDDDLFAYHYFENGAIADQYNSCPEYFGGEPGPRGGNVASLKAILPGEADRDTLNELLLAGRFTFETERFEKAATILGLANAVAAYECLQEGDRGGIRNWKKFILIPDPKPERTAKRAVEVNAKAEIKRLAAEGTLISEQIPKQIKLQRLLCAWSMIPSTGEILLAWAEGSNLETSLIRIDPATGEQTPTSIKLSNTVFRIAISPDSQWLAAGYATGDWRTELVNLNSGQRVELPQKRAVEQVCFAADSKTFFSVSENLITIARGSGWREVQTIQFANHCRTLAVHPQGEYLVAAVQGMLVVVHIPTGTSVKTVWIDARPGPKRDLLETLQTSTAPRAPSAEMVALQAFMKSRLSGDELELHHQRMRLHFLPKQDVSVMKFSHDGRLLICGTDEGLCVLDWDSVRHADNMTPLTPGIFVEAEPAFPKEDGSVSQSKHLYSITLDPVRERVLFSGTECKIRFLDLATRETGDLLTPPIARTYHNLELTPDRMALAGTGIHYAMKRQDNKPMAFQIWNYPALCKKAGLSF